MQTAIDYDLFNYIEAFHSHNNYLKVLIYATNLVQQRINA